MQVNNLFHNNFWLPFLNAFSIASPIEINSAALTYTHIHRSVIFQQPNWAEYSVCVYTCTRHFQDNARIKCFYCSIDYSEYPQVEKAVEKVETWTICRRPRCLRDFHFLKLLEIKMFLYSVLLDVDSHELCACTFSSCYLLLNINWFFSAF